MSNPYASPRPFRRRLHAQRARRDRIGALARLLTELNIEEIGWARKRDEHKLWAGIVVRYGTREHIQAFNRAWVEYCAATGEPR